MAKRQKTEIDEGLIRKMIAGEASPRKKDIQEEFSPKGTSDPSIPNEPSSNPDKKDEETIDSLLTDETPQGSGGENRRRRSMTLPDYEQTFLQPVNYDLRASLYVSRATKLKVLEIVKKIGDERLTATSFVDNILRHHITTFRDEINRIYKTRNKETIV